MRKTTQMSNYSSLYLSKILTVHSQHLLQKYGPLIQRVILCTVTVWTNVLSCVQSLFEPTFYLVYSHCLDQRVMLCTAMFGPTCYLVHSHCLDQRVILCTVTVWTNVLSCAQPLFGPTCYLVYSHCLDQRVILCTATVWTNVLCCVQSL